MENVATYLVTGVNTILVLIISIVAKTIRDKIVSTFDSIESMNAKIATITNETTELRRHITDNSIDIKKINSNIEEINKYSVEELSKINKQMIKTANILKLRKNEYEQLISQIKENKHKTESHDKFNKKSLQMHKNHSSTINQLKNELIIIKRKNEDD